MIHYHGTPISPRKALYQMAGKCFCVSYSDPRDAEICHQIGQLVMLDNGAYSFWTRGEAVDWEGFVAWARGWLEYPTTWAVMPDIIDGTEEDNRLLSSWLFEYDRDVWRRCAPVWHMHESIRALKYLCLSRERVCIGSSGRYANPGTDRWRQRMDEVMTAICNNGVAPTQLHMLRAMSQVAGGEWPFASADSTNVARNHHRTAAPSPRELADRIDAFQAPARWARRPSQLTLTFSYEVTASAPSVRVASGGDGLEHDPKMNRR